MNKITFRIVVACAGLLGLLAVTSQMRSRSRIRELEQELQRRGEPGAVLAEADDGGFKPSPNATAPTRKLGQSLTAPADQLSRSNIFARLQRETKSLTIAQVEAYLKTAGRTAPNLLAAFRTSGDAGLLREAMEKYPGDPLVAFEASFSPSLSAEEHAQWLSALKQAAPENSLGNYLAALEAMKAGRSDEAQKELAAASTKAQFNDFTLNRIQGDEDLYLASGYSLAEAKVIPYYQLKLPQLAQLRDLGTSLTDLATSYRTAGDDSAANAALEMALQLGNRYTERTTGEPEISRLVGLSIQYNAMKLMDPASPYGTTSQTVGARMAEIDNERQEFQALNDSAHDLLPQLSEQDLVSYVDHRRLFGEPEALRWAIAKFAQH